MLKILAHVWGEVGQRERIPFDPELSGRCIGPVSLPGKASSFPSYSKSMYT
jgi:hypothetical protein